MPSDGPLTPWLVYGLGDVVEMETNHHQHIKTVTVEIAIGNDKVMNDTLQNIFKVFSRYTRAIIEVLSENMPKNGVYGRPKFQQYPLPVISGAGEVVRLPGVRLTATIA
jgi:hypothetical protein